MVRAAAKNHASVAIVTSPARYPAILEALDAHGEVPLALRSALAVEAFRHTAAYDARIAAELPCRMHDAGIDLPPEPGLPGAEDPYPPVLTVSLEKVDTLRYGENPHQPAARYRRTDREPHAGDGPFAAGEPPLQGKALSYNNVLDASAAASLARLLRGPGVVIVKHTNPCGAAERPTLLEAWEAALAGDPVSAFGGVVAVTGPVDRALAERLTSIFLEVVVAPVVRRRGARGPRDEAEPPPGRGPRARGDPRRRRGRRAVDSLGSFRTAGGAVLVTAPDTLDDDPAGWTVVTTRRTDRPRARRPRPRLAPVPRRRLQRDPPRPRRDARRARLRAGEPRRRVPRRGRQGAPVPGRGRGDRRRRRVGRVLPVPGRPAACCSTPA